MKNTALGIALLLLPAAALPGLVHALPAAGSETAPPPTCAPGAANCWRTVKPAEVDNQWANARCNDGKPAGYEFRPSPIGSSDWVILFEGGGSCDDLTLFCADRNKPLTTTSPIANDSWNRIPHDGILSPSPLVNPDFAGANLVQLRYCSSDQWTGASNLRRITTATPDCTDSNQCGWYFSGRANASAAIQSLKRDHGLRDDGSQRVLFVGTSAGGFGLAANAKAMRDHLPVTHAADGLRFILDGAFLLHGWDVPGRPIGDSELTSVNAVAIQNRSFWRAQFDPQCEADRIARNLKPALCTFLSLDYPYLTAEAPAGLGLKVLVQNSTVDSVATARLRLSGPDDAAWQQWRCSVTAALASAAWLFSSDESYHTLSGSKNGLDAGWRDKTYRNLIGLFWRDEAPQRFVFSDQPCNS